MMRQLRNKGVGPHAPHAVTHFPDSSLFIPPLSLHLPVFLITLPFVTTCQLLHCLQAGVPHMASYGMCSVAMSMQQCVSFLIAPERVEYGLRCKSYAEREQTTG